MTLNVQLNQRSDDTQRNLATLIENNIASRLAAYDHTIWGPEAEEEAAIRLNWLQAAGDTRALLPEISALREQLQSEGVTRVVLSGMGGSSLAPEVIAAWANKDLTILDSTEPSSVEAILQDAAHTVLVVSSKSGSTVETDSHRRMFEEAFSAAGVDPVARIVIVTDPGSPLDRSAREAGYRVFNADPNIGGRFSALTAFGIVPSVLAGVDPVPLLDAAEELLPRLSKDTAENPANILAAALVQGDPLRNKILLVEGSAGIGLGDWIEQLVAESTGKEQTGLLPVVIGLDAPELALDDAAHSDFITVALDQQAAEALGQAELFITGDLGAVFLLWEAAISAIGYLLQINPFDQPDVESAKAAARALLETGITGKENTPLSPALSLREFANFTPAQANSDLAGLLSGFLAAAQADSYVAIQAYLNRANDTDYLGLRNLIAQASQRPVTFGWGPRFLHSTGQFHKGGQRQGLFLQLIPAGGNDLGIPGRDFTIGELLTSQADGDRSVLIEAGRPVLSLIVHDRQQALTELIDALSSIASA